MILGLPVQFPNKGDSDATAKWTMKWKVGLSGDQRLQGKASKEWCLKQMALKVIRFTSGLKLCLCSMSVLH